MNGIRVLDVFHTSIGEIAILTFPDEETPKIGMLLKREDGAIWKITGVGWPPMPSEMTNAYKNIDPPCLVFNCKIEKQSDFTLKTGGGPTRI